MSLPPPRASRAVFAGLFLVTLATLMYEIALTRIFSVTMWYHFAFVAISVAMFGMTVGALVVYLRPAWFPAERITQGLGLGSLLFGALTAAVHPWTGLRAEIVEMTRVTTPWVDPGWGLIALVVAAMMMMGGVARSGRTAQPPS